MLWKILFYLLYSLSLLWVLWLSPFSRTGSILAVVVLMVASNRLRRSVVYQERIDRNKWE